MKTSRRRRCVYKSKRLKPNTLEIKLLSQYEVLMYKSWILISTYSQEVLRLILLTSTLIVARLDDTSVLNTSVPNTMILAFGVEI